MSHGAHRAPKPKNRRLRNLAAGLSLTAAAATGIAITADQLVAQPQDTAWGAPNLDHIVDVTPLDTAWG